jgi:hypothetical protein
MVASRCFSVSQDGRCAGEAPRSCIRAACQGDHRIAMPCAVRSSAIARPVCAGANAERELPAAYGGSPPLWGLRLGEGQASWNRGTHGRDRDVPFARTLTSGGAVSCCENHALSPPRGVRIDGTWSVVSSCSCFPCSCPSLLSRALHRLSALAALPDILGLESRQIGHSAQTCQVCNISPLCAVRRRTVTHRISSRPAVFSGTRLPGV